MTIKNALRDYGQRYRPRMACLRKAEKVLLEMQDPCAGVKSQPQRLVITIIPHAITGEDIIAWLADRFQIDPQEASSFGSMLVALGYIYPLQDHKRLVIKPDTSLYRFQTPYFWPTQQWPVEDTDYAIYLAKRNIRKKGILELHEQEQYNHLHKWMNHKWDFIVMQAKEQYRAAKERKKPDRVVFDCQERAYWVVHRPPVRKHSQKLPLNNFVEVFEHDLPRPWHSIFIGFKSKFELDYSKKSNFVWASFLSEPFTCRSKIVGENLAFWEGCEDLKWGTAVAMKEKAEQIYKTFLARGAPRWINIDGKTMEITVKGLKHPHRYVLDAAQTHIYMLMKKDSYGRYLKSPVFKETLKKAVNPEEHKFNEVQLEQNARNRRPSLSPIIIRQQEQEQRAKMAASAPVDITQVMSKLSKQGKEMGPRHSK
uniref:Regulator of G protein signaling 9b n=1 Tax=Fundulus heteroclitus TaxID=8078 RepID=A0A3Q2T2I9_FUNHE